MAAAGRDDLALAQEIVRHGDRLIQQAARIVAQVEHDAGELGAGLAAQVLDGVLDAAVGLLVEAGDADIADIVAFELFLHRLDLDDGALHRDVERILALALDGELDLAAHGPAHALDRVVEAHALDRFAVDLHDEVAGLEARVRGRRVVDRRHHLDDAVLHRDLDAEAAELAAHLDLHVAEILGVHVARMRVERAQHAVDRGLDELLVRHVLDIVGADPLEHLAEQVELAISVRIGRLRRLRRIGGAHRGRKQEEGRGDRCQGRTHHPFTFSRRVASHGMGLIGWLSWRSSK